MTEPHLAEDVIWSFLAGELADQELVAIEAHLDLCDRCNEQLSAMAELLQEVPELFPLEEPLETPSAGFADRIMMQIAAQEADRPVHAVVSAVRKRRRSPAFDWFTRTATAAVMTGFMVLGSLHSGINYSTTPVVGSISTALAATGTAVSEGTINLTSKLDQILDGNWTIAK